tara:strand:+ start:97 stop:846 length:750 start_codon:yes stop_codon:yes gene_type:complete
LIDLAVREMTAAVMMTEAEEEMTGEILDEITAETSQETTDVEMTGITVLEDMTAEIHMETMIGIVQNAIIPTSLEEWNVTDVVLQSQVVETLVIEETLDMILAHQEEIIDETHETEITTDQSAKRLLTMIGNVKSVITLIFHLEQNVIGVENLNLAVEEITETVGSKETTAKDEIEAHVESVDQEEMTARVEGVVETTEVADNGEMIARVEKEEHAENEILTLLNSVAPEGNPQVMPTTEGHNRLILVH